ncbi:MAG: aminotransferase class V-fold PLP-dependent enzyme, partial [Ginsengibacter sp.]
MNSIKDQFLLAPAVTYLNHGSFGACPRPVFENYQYWQRALETEPVQFISKISPEALLSSKQALAKYIGCDSDDFFFTQNPTMAVNQVVKSLNFQPGDEVLTTNLEYGAIGKTFNFYSKKYGFTYRKQNISLPLISKEKFIEEFWKGYNQNTKAISL